MVLFMLLEVGNVKLRLQISHLPFQSSRLSSPLFARAAKNLMDISSKMSH